MAANEKAEQSPGARSLGLGGKSILIRRNLLLQIRDVRISIVAVEGECFYGHSSEGIGDLPAGKCGSRFEPAAEARGMTCPLRTAFSVSSGSLLGANGGLRTSN